MIIRVLFSLLVSPIVQTGTSVSVTHRFYHTWVLPWKVLVPEGEVATPTDEMVYVKTYPDDDSLRPKIVCLVN